jgi:SAM-dependent methyltransferase
MPLCLNGGQFVARDPTLSREVVLNPSVFPPEFSPETLRRLYPDLAPFNDDQLRDHFRLHGRQEGRTSSEADTREALIALIKPEADILEIGPSWSPVFRGPNVRYFDISPTESLKARAREHGVDEALCPEIHYTGALEAIDQKFDVVFSSHVLACQPDLIRHLQAAASLLRDGGLYVILAPDKRYGFDHFLPPTTVAEVLEAYVERRKRHAPRHIVEHIAFTTHNEAGEHWMVRHGESPFERPDERLQAAFDRLQADDGPIDVRAWKFTPEVFREVFAGLRAINQEPLRTLRVYETPQGRNEFGVVLQKL